MCSKKLTNKKQKIFSEKQKGFRDGQLEVTEMLECKVNLTA